MTVAASAIGSIITVLRSAPAVALRALRLEPRHLLLGWPIQVAHQWSLTLGEHLKRVMVAVGCR